MNCFCIFWYLFLCEEIWCLNDTDSSFLLTKKNMNIFILCINPTQESGVSVSQWSSRDQWQTYDRYQTTDSTSSSGHISGPGLRNNFLLKIVKYGRPCKGFQSKRPNLDGGQTGAWQALIVQHVDPSAKMLSIFTCNPYALFIIKWECVWLYGSLFSLKYNQALNKQSSKEKR